MVGSTLLRWKLDLMGLRGIPRDVNRLMFWRKYARRGGLYCEAQLESLGRQTGRQLSLRDASRHRRLKLLEALVGREQFARLVRAYTGTASAPVSRQPSGKKGPGPRRRRKPDVRRAARVVDTVRVR